MERQEKKKYKECKQHHRQWEKNTTTKLVAVTNNMCYNYAFIFSRNAFKMNFKVSEKASI